MTDDTYPTDDPTDDPSWDTPTQITSTVRLRREIQAQQQAHQQRLKRQGNLLATVGVLLMLALLIGSASVSLAHANAAPSVPLVGWSSASPSPAPLLAGEALWNGVPADIYGGGDTYDYIGATGFDHSTTIQSQVKAAGVPLIRAFFEEVDETDHTTPNTDAHQLAIAQAIHNSGAACMANLTQPMDTTYALHLVTLLAPYCRYFEVYNEPDLSGVWPPAVSVANYLSFWKSFVPQARALDPTAQFGGPATADEFGLDSTGTYMQDVLAGMASSGVWPDFVSYHFYICAGDPQSSCLSDASTYTTGHGKTVAGWIAADFPGKAIPLGITEWSADPGNPSWAYDDAFMSQFEQAALSGFAQNPYLSFATQFDLASYAGYGTLDLFRTDSGEPYTNTPAAVGSARPLFGALASAIALAQSGGITTGGGGSTPTPTPVPPTPSPTPSPTASGVPAYDHVITIVMENHSYSEIIGSSSAPYINGTLIKSGALATNYTANVQSSLPNYLALTGGSTLGLTSNCEPGAGCQSSGPSIAGEALAAGKSWRAYEENMTTTCQNVVDGGLNGLYTVHHNPFPYYTGLVSSCQQNDVNYSQLATDLQSSASLPAYVFVTPNLNDDMHNGTIAQGDAWLAQQIPAIQHSAACVQSRCLIAITWDEGSYDASGNPLSPQVATILLGPDVQAGARDGTAYTHYALLHTTEAALGLPTMTSNDASAPLMTPMFAAGAGGTPTPTPTPNPSPSPTPVPPSPTPSPTQPPSGSTIFSDSFEADGLGNAPTGWTITSGAWMVEADSSSGSGAQALRQITSPEASSYLSAGSSAWTDYTLTAQIKPASGSGLFGTYNLMGRYQGVNDHYSLILKNGDEWWLGYKQSGVWNTLAAGTFSYQASQWYTLSLTFSGSKITASINGKVLASVSDGTFSHGAIGWNTNASGELDNVSVVTPGGTPTPTPTPVPPTPTPSPTPTPQPINNVPCTVVLSGVSEQGTCSGTFIP